MDPMTNFEQKTYLIQEEPRGPSMLVEIPVTINSRSTINFPDIPELRSDTDRKIIIKAIRCIPATVLSNAPVTGNATAPLTELVKISLLLYAEGWNKGQNIPLLTLVDTFTEGSGIPYRNRTAQFANWDRVIWEKCQLVYSNTQTSAGQPYSVLLEVEYVRLDSDGNEIVGPA